MVFKLLSANVSSLSFNLSRDPILLSVNVSRKVCCLRAEAFLLSSSYKYRGSFIQDTIAEMQWWACFKQDTRPAYKQPTAVNQPVHSTRQK